MALPSVIHLFKISFDLSLVSKVLPNTKKVALTSFSLSISSIFSVLGLGPSSNVRNIYFLSSIFCPLTILSTSAAAIANFSPPYVILLFGIISVSFGATVVSVETSSLVFKASSLGDEVREILLFLNKGEISFRIEIKKIARIDAAIILFLIISFLEYRLVYFVLYVFC